MRGSTLPIAAGLFAIASALLVQAHDNSPGPPICGLICAVMLLVSVADFFSRGSGGGRSGPSDS
jgi:hypothetical protein